MEEDQRIKRLLGISSRPIEFFVGFNLAFIGVLGFLDPNFPEKYTGWQNTILTWEHVYLITAGLVIMASLVLRGHCSDKKWAARTIVAEQFAWLFVAFVALSNIIGSPWVPITAFPAEPWTPIWFAWVFWWLMLGSMSYMKYRDIKKFFYGSAS